MGKDKLFEKILKHKIKPQLKAAMSKISCLRKNRAEKSQA